MCPAPPPCGIGGLKSMEGHMANIKETADILDVLVIGSGIAGLSAAVSACDMGVTGHVGLRLRVEQFQ